MHGMKLSPQLIAGIEEAVNLNIRSARELRGGDISQAWHLATNKQELFVKCNSHSAASAMFAAEAEGLNALRSAFSGVVPVVLGQGLAGSHAFVVMQYLKSSSSPTRNHMQQFGSMLAELHRHTHTAFGWQHSNFIATTTQQNNWCSSWPQFLAEQRILPLVKRLVTTQQFSLHDASAAEMLCKRFEELMPAEPPSLLHGDLWSGNYMVMADGLPAIFDPAVYYGHREIDIAMTLLFGGFETSFYAAYQESWPLQAGWERRLSIMQLYPLLVHALLFGGAYVSRCRAIVQAYTW